jgi:hypothetical protein
MRDPRRLLNYRTTPDPDGSELFHPEWTLTRSS